jgi:hypothetical protein
MIADTAAGGAHEAGQDVGVEQEAHRSEGYRLVRELVDGREILVDRVQGRQQGEQGARRRRFDDEPIAFLAKDRILPRQLELARNADRLVTTVSEKPDVSLRHHPGLL